MKAALRYRLFHAGKMPEEFRPEAARPDALLVAEGVSVKASSRSIRLPGVRTRVGVQLLVGSVVILPDRLLAGIGRYPILDTDFKTGGRPGQELTLSEDEMVIHIDVQSVFSGGSGTVDLHYRGPIGLGGPGPRSVHELPGLRVGLRPPAAQTLGLSTC